MPSSVIHSKTLAAASANNICLSQSAAGAGKLTINGAAAAGGVATLDTQRRVLITSAGNDSARTATITGTRGTGQVISESLAMGNIAAVPSVLDYFTVTSIAVDGATASTVTVGTNTTGSTNWIMPDYHLTPFSVGIATQITNTVTYTIDGTLDDFVTVQNPTTQPRVVSIAASASAAAAVTLSVPYTGFRFTITSGTGTLSAESLQAGIANY